MNHKDKKELTKHFLELEDPRRKRKCLHKLIDILFIAICAVIANAESFVDIEEFGKAKIKFFKKILKLPNGIPSHDTFGRVFSLLNPGVLKKCFHNWIAEIVKKVNGEVVAIDGKTVRRSFSKTNKKSAIHIVSAWASESKIVLGQVKVNEKSNEITAIPELLEILNIKGCTITIDAMGTQKSIAEIIIDKESNYVLSLKDNHKTLCEDVKLIFEEPEKMPDMGIQYDYSKTVDKDHGRIEIRECFTTDNIDWLNGKEEWKGLKTIVMLKSSRTLNGETSTEKRYYLSSLDSDADKIMASIRSHWSIENSLHWVLDLAFREDDSRIRKDHAPENFNTLRHIAVNLLKQEKSRKIGIKAKRKAAGWDEDYLISILSQF